MDSIAGVQNTEFETHNNQVDDAMRQIMYHIISKRKELKHIMIM